MRRAIPQSRFLRIAGAPARGVGHDLQEDIAAKLRASYDDLLQQPLPTALRALVERLEVTGTRRDAPDAAPKGRARLKA